MKKTSLILSFLLVIAIIILFLSFNNLNKNYVYAKDIDFNNDNQLIAIAYLNDLSEVKSKYININNIKIYKINDDNMCLIIPRYKNMNIKIYNNTEDKNDLIGTTSSAFTITNDSNIVLEIEYNDEVYKYLFNKKESKYVLDITK